MLSTRGASKLRSCNRARSSYIEVSRYVRRTLIDLQEEKNVPFETWRCLHQTRCLNSSIGNDSSQAFIQTYKSSISFPPATDSINTLDNDTKPVDREVILHGYLGQRNDLSKKLSFIPLLSRDLSHSVQIVSATKNADENRIRTHEQLKTLSQGTPVAVRGLLKTREAATSKDLGEITKVKSKELEIHEVQQLNEFPKDIIIDRESIFGPERRHLQLRQEKGLRDALKVRSEVSRFCRNWLCDRDFSEIETPLLFKSTPEGAAEFIVPTRRKGLAYALPQSPQQFKQILMGSGISRYFQIARCFRDEDLRADRQPEFTQLDLEMAFASAEDVRQHIEELLRGLWAAVADIQLPQPFPRLSYQDAMSKYGSDKPDTRLGMEIRRIDHLIPADLVSKISPLNFQAVDAMCVKLGDNGHDPQTARRFIGSFLESPDGQLFNSCPDGAPGIFICDSSKPLGGLQPFGFEAAEQIEEIFNPEDGDIIVIQARPEQLAGGSTAIGNLRLALHREAVKQELLPKAEGFAPLWIVDFPLFSATSENEPGQGGTAGLASTHHPFTSPKTPEDVDLLTTDPRSVVGDHYDIVMNGAELGGGSRRIHNAQMQRFIMEDILKMSTERMAEFDHLIQVLRAGCPPHAGIALGFDRLIAVMLGKESVRDVIAFPKSGRGEDLLVKSPGKITSEALERYHLKIL